MHAESYLSKVREQYEAYPFPVRRPENERRALIPSEIDRLGKIDHFCLGGRKNFERGDLDRPFRVLIAGGGTADALIYLGERRWCMNLTRAAGPPSPGAHAPIE